MDWFDKEMDALDSLFESGAISREEYNLEVRCLRQDAKEQEDRQSIIDAGRGYLLRDY